MSANLISDEKSRYMRMLERGVITQENYDKVMEGLENMESSPVQDFIDDNLPAMIAGYKQAIYFTETEKDGITHESPISSELEAKIATECESFLSECWKYCLLLPDFDAVLLGHNFWLDRNGHGAGFWDRGDVYGEIQAEKLSGLAHSYGETWVYLGDDGQIWD